MQQICRQCQQSFEITDDDLAFYDKVSPVFNGKKEPIPPPTLCPDCRQRNRWAFQNQRFLYNRTSSKTGKNIISTHSADKPFPVFEKEEWLKIDSTDLGRPFDFSRTFFEQFAELFFAMPKAAVLQTGVMINSDYTHFVGELKNCYLIFDCGQCEDCMYGYFMGYNRSCLDVMHMQRNELCYDSVNLADCYGLFHSTFCRNCSNSAYLFDCIGCKHCIACANLRNKEYCIFNAFVGKEEFEKTWHRLFDGSHATKDAFEQRWKDFSLTCPRRAVHNTNSPGCTGDYLVNCENTIDCYQCFEIRDSKRCQYCVIQGNDCHDISSFGELSSFCYQLSGSGGLQNKVSMNNCCFDVNVFYGGSSVYYSINCLDNCHDLFGCADIRGKRFCILNRQYSQDEYEALVPKIIGHMRETGEWGEFFPVTLSPYSYNESVANDHFPLTREQTISMGYAWREQDAKEYRPATAVAPDIIDDVPDTIVHERLACVECMKNYRITSKELEFYHTHHLPLPRFCPDCRHLHRLRRRNPQKLWNRECAKCHKAIQTSYAPERPEIVYCESCYLAEVY